MPKRTPHCLRCAAALAAALASLPGTASAQGGADACGPWSEWQDFKRLYLSEDGRVIDASTAQAVTVSEGQAYALTFALIANDPASFAKVLRWTGDNLAGGSLRHALPAWKWGHAADGRWGVLDRNSAADADLWLAYTLGEAARLWRNAAYGQLGEALAALIRREEVTLVPGLGATLLPGPRGFVSEATWRLNASYVPLQLLRGLSGHDRQWNGVLESARRVISGSAPHGYAADWVQYREADAFTADPVTAGVGSYDAIRVYLWAGMLAPDDPEVTGLIQQLRPIAQAAVRGPPPESIDTRTLEAHGTGSPGFLAALLPLLTQLRLTATVKEYRARVEAESLKDNQHYYSDVLTLFGLGWLKGRYRFDRHGELKVEWTGRCRAG
jgi:endo-1,4-beta-D-glucanase Y